MSASAPTVAAPASPPRRRRKWIVGLAVALLVLALVVLAAVCWSFSSLIVVPDHSALPRNTTALSASPGKVVLSRSDDSLRPGVYGLDWHDGHAIVGPVLAGDSRSVTRQLRDVRGGLAPGTKATLDSSVYQGNPRQTVGLAFANVAVPSELGVMPAWLIPARSHTWAILVHGINGNRENNLRFVPPLHSAGLPTLLITYRGDVGAPRGPDGLHHMGLTEWRDLQAAARYALAHGAQRLVLLGSSMGGAIVTQFMEHSSLAGRVSGLVLDAPALSWTKILAFNAKEKGFPSFGAKPVEWVIGLRISADWSGLEALHHTSSFHLPILLFHGTEDKVVPISLSDAFARELPAWVTYYRVPHAGHVESWNVDSISYDRRLTAFLSRLGA